MQIKLSHTHVRRFSVVEKIFYLIMSLCETTYFSLASYEKMKLAIVFLLFIYLFISCGINFISIALFILTTFFLIGIVVRICFLTSILFEM